VTTASQRHPGRLRPIRSSPNLPQFPFRFPLALTALGNRNGNDPRRTWADVHQKARSCSKARVIAHLGLSMITREGTTENHSKARRWQPSHVITV